MTDAPLSRRMIRVLHKLVRLDRPLSISDFERQTAPVTLHNHGYTRVTVEITEKGLKFLKQWDAAHDR